ncbi:unnamed protein product [Calicophoron daubneyi]|uniref:Ig-like domain-containing protein n=1 Tax=Calicophoron daubneyi TaxID=300641 RepID=A0AAV2TPC6_CALDB
MLPKIHSSSAIWLIVFGGGLSKPAETSTPNAYTSSGIAPLIVLPVSLKHKITVCILLSLLSLRYYCYWFVCLRHSLPSPLVPVLIQLMLYIKPTEQRAVVPADNDSPQTFVPVHVRQNSPVGKTHNEHSILFETSPHNCPIVRNRMGPLSFADERDTFRSNQSRLGEIYTPMPAIQYRDHRTDWPVVYKAGKLEPCFDPYESVHITARAQSAVHIPCTVHNIDFGVTVMSWWKEGSLRELTVGNEVSSRRYKIDRSNPHSWTLVIQNATKSDSGTYICQINLSKLKEKFYYLSVVEPKKLADTTKLNDESVMDEVTTNTQARENDVRIDGDAEGISGQPHVLSCLSTFMSRDHTSTVHWFHNNQRQYSINERKFPTSAGHMVSDRPDQMWMFNGQQNITEHWINNSTLFSILHISSLNLSYAGTWKCVKYSKNFFERPGDASFRLRVRTKNIQSSTSHDRDSTQQSDSKAPDGCLRRRLTFGVESLITFILIGFANL